MRSLSIGSFFSVVAVVSARITHTFSPRRRLLFFPVEGKREEDFADRYVCKAELTRRVSLGFHLVSRPSASARLFISRMDGGTGAPNETFCWMLFELRLVQHQCNEHKRREETRDNTHTHTQDYNKRMTRKEKSRAGLTNRYCRRSVWQKTDSRTH